MKYTKTLLSALFVFSVIFIKAQIPAGYYNGTDDLNGDELKSALHNIIKDHVEFSYNDLRDFILRNTDEDPDNPNNVILFYTGRTQAKTTFGGGANEWNREHVWAKSHGDFGTAPPCGTDAHHMKPTDVSVNSTRSNLDFDIGGTPVTEAPGCYRDSDSFEPRDAVKGDVARMIFYMAVRYEGDNGEPDLEVVDRVNTSPAPEHGKLSQLILWNELDPPDDFEMNRNDVIYYQYQNNRNPFIDHPEFVERIWGDPSSTTDIKKIDFKIYPNPAASSITLSGNISECSYMIFNSLGGVIMKGNIPYQKYSLDVRLLPPGLYSISILNKNGVKSTSKLTKL